MTQHQPGIPVLRVSARTGDGFEGLTQFLAQDGDFGRRVLDIDYDIYADGEAELGWLNSNISVQADTEFPMDQVLLDILNRLQESLAEVGAETAHLKAIGLWEGFFGVANLISSENQPELSLASNQNAKSFDLIVNARVVCDPEVLEKLVLAAVSEACTAIGATAEFRETRSFRPGRPVPTHRFADE